ncbi:MAG: hypothetical protein ABS948_12030 [Solibacillus sp.]
MLTVKDVMETIAKLEDEYHNLRANIADDFNDDWIDKALPKIEKLKSLRKAIEDAKNFEVKI